MHPFVLLGVALVAEERRRGVTRQQLDHEERRQRDQEQHDDEAEPNRVIVRIICYPRVPGRSDVAAAVDADHLPRDVARIFRTQERARGRDVVRDARPADRIRDADLRVRRRAVLERCELRSIGVSTAAAGSC